MKKLSKKQRDRDLRLSIKHRKGSSNNEKKLSDIVISQEWKAANKWIDEYNNNGLDITIHKKRLVEIHLPSIMNFNENYEETALHIAAIRKLTEHRNVPRKAYRLVKVDFKKLEEISTSSALVLTAELSKWDDSIRTKLKPNTEEWNCGIVKQFSELGFFDLFLVEESEKNDYVNSCSDTGISVVKYIKGRCKDKSKTRILKKCIGEIVGDKINKWTFLDCGLSEAITNVSHHAYPIKYSYSEEDKNWYLTGSYNKDTSELKVVFYDQGIGIPKSLPASDIWETILTWFSAHPAIDRKRHEVLLKAAVELDRTSTLDSDRGKGLQDLLEFVKHRGEGYLSIFSLKGLYKYSMENGKHKMKTEGFDQKIYGTLIIWSVVLK